MDDYLDRLKKWEKDVADPVIYENIDNLFPEYKFSRMNNFKPHDRWISPLKIDLSTPKVPNRQKTVIQPTDLMFREQGEWEDGVSVKRMLMDKLNFSSIFELYCHIAETFGLDMPSPADVPASGDARKSHNRRQLLLTKLEEYFNWNLFNNNHPMCVKTREYLEKRGFSRVMMSSLKFGFVPSWGKVEAYMTSPRMGFAVSEFNAACKVRNDEGNATVGSRHVLAIPYRANGEIKGFLFRAIESDVQPKYRANTGLDRKSQFFNMPVKDKTIRALVVVEGEMDALIATACGIPNVVAVGGSEIRDEQIFDAFSHNIKALYFCFDLDKDKDGIPNRLKRYNVNKRSILAVFNKNMNFNKIFIADFPYPADPDEYIRKEGAQAFRDLVLRSRPWHQYLHEEMLSIQTENTPR